MPVCVNASRARIDITKHLGFPFSIELPKVSLREAPVNAKPELQGVLLEAYRGCLCDPAPWTRWNGSVDSGRP
jgi:hypothetical protein